MEESFSAGWGDFYQDARKYVPHPLYPERDARRDHRRVLSALKDFLATYGYWPANEELSTFLKADHGGVVHCLKNLCRMGLTTRNGRRAGRAFHELSPLGWKALGLRPIEPWIRRPRRLLTRIAHRVTIDLYDIEEAQRRLDEREGTFLQRNGNAASYETRHYIPEDERRPQLREEKGELPPWL